MTELDIPTTLGRLHVRTEGSGPAILMWPSLLMDGALWSAQVEHFRDRFTVIAVDPPGHGASEALTEPFTFEQCATVVCEVLDHLDIERAHVLGNSWGGMIGGTFAALHPERVGVSVLMNATASPAPLGQKLEYGLLLRTASLLGGLRGPLMPSVLKAFLGPTSLKTRPAVVQHVRDTAGRNDISSAAWAVRSVVPRRPDQRELFSTVSTPVLVVAGEEDATFGLAETHAMADAIPGSTYVVIDGAAHLAALEAPAEVNRLVDEFIAAHP
ncbi:alpha/beta fold hydrolase [Aeromicrobium panaciterrae]|uniref:alpha/beta fold hydrolase n=1 Tax=Aeromicrobium panaciterrae TaxID=363861 RepID=UPI0031DB8B5C